MKRNHFILIFYFLFNSYSNAAVLDFLPILEKKCEPKVSIFTKKILIELVGINKKKYIKNQNCTNSLKIFLSKCTKSIDCEELTAEFHDYINKQNGAVIGE